VPVKKSPEVLPPQETDQEHMAAVFTAWLSHAMLAAAAASTPAPTAPAEDDLVIEVEDPGPPVERGVQLIVKTCRNCHRPYTLDSWRARPLLRRESLPARGLGLEWRKCCCDIELALSTGTPIDDES
jgi:hypothetical protein